MDNEDGDADRAHWSRVADQWIAWARAPGHDAFWAYRDALLAFVGPGTGAALDVGCGEGRVARALKSLGYRVTAVDPVEQFVAAAAAADSADAYAVAPAATLPFAPASFDLAMAYNMLMDVQDVPAALAGIRRVLRPDGALFVSIVHPFVDRGQFADARPDAPFVLQGAYFGRQRFEGTEARNGLSMDFAGWSQPLEDYMAALEQAGFALVALREPRPDTRVRPDLDRWRRLPMFLWLKARPLA
ncbi:methyltransferase domain-containing protein [Bordetella petrii]|uniref:class I SAM-dependent methyltransferase n=1 Tax=Bordetella petrii TaxID=94624 RepID=UPI00372E779C